MNKIFKFILIAFAILAVASLIVIGFWALIIAFVAQILITLFFVTIFYLILSRFIDSVLWNFSISLILCNVIALAIFKNITLVLPSIVLSLLIIVPMYYIKKLFFKPKEEIKKELSS